MAGLIDLTVIIGMVMIISLAESILLTHGSAAFLDWQSLQPAGLFAVFGTIVLLHLIY